ncbi:MAG: hypothetical protein MI747_15890 [Desulfobacterales bacterium]|nr:hypothetical protein [Desulfobacterales bacterium]
MKNAKKLLAIALMALWLPAGAAMAETSADDKALGKTAVDLDAKIKKSYLTFVTEDGQFEYKIDGRIMLDTGIVKNDKDANQLNEDTQFRRVRLGIKAKMFQDWRGEFDLDFAENEVDIKDMWMSYEGFENTSIKIGNHKPAFSLNEVTTSRWGTFMEASSVADSFSPGRHIGLSATNYGKFGINYFASATIFGDEVGEDHVDDDDKDNYTGASSTGLAARFVAQPYISDNGDTVIAFGANYLRQQPDSEAEDKVDFDARPEARFLDYKFQDTKKIKNTDHWDVYGAELAGKYKRLSWQAEYMINKVSVSDDTVAPEFDGWYAYVSYFLTDDQRPWDAKDAEFAGIVPNGKYGAWEVALRYSNLDLNDFDRWGDDLDDNGGESDSWTLALNWYINNNFMVKANYIHTKYDKYANGGGDLEGGDTLDTVGMRFQFLF